MSLKFTEGLTNESSTNTEKTGHISGIMQSEELGLMWWGFDAGGGVSNGRGKSAGGGIRQSRFYLTGQR